MKRFIFLATNIAVISFLLNIVWENAQAPFYAGYTGFWQHFSLCFFGTLGDVVIIAFLYGIFALVYRDIYWIQSLNTPSITLLALAGMIVAILIEYYALSVGRWAYAPAMPPFLWTKAGLWPVLQMILLPYVVFRLSAWNTDRRNIC
jgi:hypothetical protein